MDRGFPILHIVRCRFGATGAPAAHHPNIGPPAVVDPATYDAFALAAAPAYAHHPFAPHHHPGFLHHRPAARCAHACGMDYQY